MRLMPCKQAAPYHQWISFLQVSLVDNDPEALEAALYKPEGPLGQFYSSHMKEHGPAFPVAQWQRVRLTSQESQV